MPDPLGAGFGQRARARSAEGLNVDHRPGLRAPSPAHSQHGCGGFQQSQQSHVDQQHQMPVTSWQFGNFLAPPETGDQHAQQQQLQHNDLLGMGMCRVGGGSCGLDGPATTAFDFNTWYPTSTTGFEFDLLPSTGDLFGESSHVYTMPQHQAQSQIHPQPPLHDPDQDVSVVLDQAMFAHVNTGLVPEALYAKCWRCGVYQIECDNSSPCRECQKPMTDNSWMDLGCRRGSLAQHMPYVTLCPNSGANRGSLDEPLPRIRVANQLLAASATVIRNSWERLSKVLSDPRDPPQKIMLEMLCQPGDLARLRTSMQTDPRLVAAAEQEVAETEGYKAATNTVGVVWELLDNPTTRGILNIQSVEMTTEALKAATTFEAESGQSLLISSAVASMKSCLEALRIRSVGNGSLTGDAHAGCSEGDCRLPCFNHFQQSNAIFLEQLSDLISKQGTNVQTDGWWWLSWFYSLWIQAYVRRALMVIERHLQPRLVVDEGVKNSLSRVSFTHMHLAVRTFRAASAGYDPLILPWTVEELPGFAESDSPHPLRFLKYLRHAQRAFQTDSWQELGIFSTFDYLERLFEVGGSDLARQHPLQSELPYRESSTAEKRKSHGSVSRTSTKRRASADRRPYGHNIPPSPAYSQSSIDARYAQAISASASPRRIYSRSPSIDAAMATGFRESSTDSLNGLGISMTEQWHAHSPTNSDASDDGSELPLVPTLLSSSRGKKQRQDKVPTPRRRTAARGRSGLVCGCCPKKPRTFATAEELGAHEAEKTFECPTCHNRFKNKNEAERHRNTLHVRRYSWSCSIIAEAAAAFFPDNAAGCDICGYCGLKFKWRNSGNRRAAKSGTAMPKRKRLSWGDEIVVERDQGAGAGNDKRVETSKSEIPHDHERNDDHDDEDADQENDGETDAGSSDEDGSGEEMAERIEHIMTVHRFGKCSAGKKFYRADHFRQHLKHSHGSIPGKWTNVLEDACRVHEATGIAAKAKGEA